MIYAFSETEASPVTVPLVFPIGVLTVLVVTAVVSFSIFALINHKIKRSGAVVEGLKESIFISSCGLLMGLSIVLMFVPTISSNSFFAATYGGKFYQRSDVPESFEYKHEGVTVPLRSFMSNYQNECVSSFTEDGGFNPGDTVVVKKGNHGALAVVDDNGNTATELKHLVTRDFSFYNAKELARFDLSKYQVCKNLDKGGLSDF